MSAAIGWHHQESFTQLKEDGLPRKLPTQPAILQQGEQWSRGGKVKAESSQAVVAGLPLTLARLRAFFGGGGERKERETQPSQTRSELLAKTCKGVIRRWPREKGYRCCCRDIERKSSPD